MKSTLSMLVLSGYKECVYPPLKREGKFVRKWTESASLPTNCDLDLLKILAIIVSEASNKCERI